MLTIWPVSLFPTAWGFVLERMIEYIVTRWPTCPSMATQQATIKVHVNAANHLEALELSGLKEPGALISVNDVGGMNVRYQVDDDGKLMN